MTPNSNLGPTEREERISRVRHAIDRLRPTKLITLEEIVTETGLGPASVEDAMAHLEKADPVLAVRVTHEGELAWKLRR